MKRFTDLLVAGGRHWRHVVAVAATTIAVARVGIWLAKAAGAVGTLEAIASAAGYADAVADFEAVVDQGIDLALAVTRWVLDRFQG